MVVVGMSGLDDLDIALGNCLVCSGSGKLALTSDEDAVKCEACNGSGKEFKGLHVGDPCVYCEMPRDDVEIGDCTFVPAAQQNVPADPQSLAHSRKVGYNPSITKRLNFSVMFPDCD